MSETRTNRRFSALVLSVDKIQPNSPAFQQQKTTVEHFNAVFQAMSKRVAPRASVAMWRLPRGGRCPGAEVTPRSARSSI